MSKLLVIDDEESVLYSFRYVFEDEEVQVLTAQTASEGLQLLQENQPDVIVLDIQLPDRSGMDVFQEIQALDLKIPVVFMTAHGTTETAIEAMKKGAFDYLIKPVALERLQQILARAFDAVRLMRVPALLPVVDQGERIIGRSLIMQEMCKNLGRIAPQDVNVLIMGESGTGKELVARALYLHSRRNDKPFLAINCAAIPETLLESELFGHEQGAFTGAHRRRIGKFEQCDRGTLFLDEIGDMPQSLQAKMLRVLQEQRFERLGSNETLQTHVRLLAATNQDLEKLVVEGKFRIDLYYRLKGITIRVPPLREHREDVAELAHNFMFRFNHELGMDIRTIAPATLELLQGYSWPGNVRELQGMIRLAMLQASGHVLFPEFFPQEIRQAVAADADHSTPTQPGTPSSPTLQSLVENLIHSGGKDLYAKAVESLERVLVPRILRHTQGHQTNASELLGISRNTLRQKMRSLGFAIDRVFTDDTPASEPDAIAEPSKSLKDTTIG
jgi:two-component system nitrogen regulation response regulator GlnG